MLINWKSGFFSSKDEAYEGGEKIGEISSGMWSSKTHANLYDHAYTFKNKSSFGYETLIFDVESGEQIGFVKEHGWNGSAKLFIDSNEYLFKPANFWSTHFEVRASDGTDLIYKNSTTVGSLEPKGKQAAVLLMGKYLINKNRQTLIIIISSMVIIMAAL